MTDNEKRAHDLAIAYMPYVMQNIGELIRSEDGVSASVSFFDLYIQTYQQLLQDMKDAFPEE